MWTKHLSVKCLFLDELLYSHSSSKCGIAVELRHNNSDIMENEKRKTIAPP